MEKKTLWQILCPYKLTTKEKALVGWFAISLALLCISDNAPLLAIIAVLANFCASAYCLHFVHLKGEEGE